MGDVPDFSASLEGVASRAVKLAADYDKGDGLKETKLKSSSFSGEMSFKKKAGWFQEGVATGRCSDVIDAPIEQVLAFVWDFCSNQRMRIHREQGQIARLTLSDDGRETKVAVIKRMPWPLSNREFLAQLTWWKDVDGVIFIANETFHDKIDYGMSFRTVKGYVVSLFKLDPVSERQCKFTTTLHIDAAGLIPAFVVELKIASSLALVEEARENFNRGEEIDLLETTALCDLMKRAGEALVGDLPMLVDGGEAYPHTLI